jgi:glyoxalase/bleomycin resistance protein/dioxygenase superfamily protein
VDDDDHRAVGQFHPQERTVTMPPVILRMEQFRHHAQTVPGTVAAVMFERIAPTFPVRDVAAALDFYGRPATAYLYVTDADALAAEWRAAGAEVHGPEDTPWGQHEGALVDPDGNIIRFGSPIGA